MAFITAPLYISLPFMFVGILTMLVAIRDTAQATDLDGRLIGIVCKIFLVVFVAIAAASIVDKIVL